MYTRMSKLILVVSLVALISFCNQPVDPNTESKNAKIRTENISEIPDSVAAGTLYTCSLTVSLPTLIDSLSVTVHRDSEITTLISGILTNDTLGFLLKFLQPGNYTVTVVLYKDGKNDSLVKKIYAISTTPVAKFPVSRIDMFIGQTITIPFTLSDPDSNLMSYIINTNGVPTDTIEALFSQRFSLASAVLPDLIPKLQKENIYSIIGMDADSQSSFAAYCTLSVKDSILPLIQLITPFNDTNVIVTTLPCTLLYVVKENWIIDSLKNSGFHQNISQNDTFKIFKTSLDTGVTRDSLEAWDRAGNRTVILYKLTYHGLKLFPPQLKPITITPIFERDTFDTLKLDQFVIITDTAASYTKDSLIWNITVDSADPFIIHHFNPVKRTLYVAVKNTEIGHDRYAAYNIKVTDPKGLSDELYRVVFWVIEKNDAPVITLTAKSKVFGSPFDTLKLDTCGYDTDVADRITWTIQAGKYFKPDSIRQLILKSGLAPVKSLFSGRVAIIPDTAMTSKVPFDKPIVDSLKFTMTDGQITTNKYVKYTWTRLILKPIEF